MCTGAEIGLLLAAGSTAVATYSAVDAHEKGRSAANKAKDTALQQEMANNRLNGKTPDLAALDSQNAMSAKGGPSGTLLTGPGGIDPNKLLLGRTTLLGG